MSSRVLVVDDNPEVMYVLTETLIAAGYAVQTAVNGREAIDLFTADRPDAVLLDIRMPAMSGIDVFFELRRIDARVPVIFVTASADEATARELLRAGAADFVSKPVDGNYLRLCVAAATGTPWSIDAARADEPALAKPAALRLAYGLVALSRRLRGPDRDRIRLEKLAHEALRYAIVGRPDTALASLLEVRGWFADGSLGWLAPADAKALRAELIAVDRYVSASQHTVPADQRELLAS
jgi:CheY-like chemotaxis protein